MKRPFWDKVLNYLEHTFFGLILALVFMIQASIWLYVGDLFHEVEAGIFIFLNVGGFAMFVKELSEKITDQWRVYDVYGIDAGIKGLRHVFGLDLYTDPTNKRWAPSRDPLWDWVITYMILSFVGITV